MSKTIALLYKLALKLTSNLIDVSKLIISTFTLDLTTSSKRVIVTTINNNDSSTYSDSNISNSNVNKYIKEYFKIN